MHAYIHVCVCVRVCVCVCIHTHHTPKCMRASFRYFICKTMEPTADRISTYVSLKKKSIFVPKNQSDTSFAKQWNQSRDYQHIRQPEKKKVYLYPKTFVPKNSIFVPKNQRHRTSAHTYVSLAKKNEKKFSVLSCRFYYYRYNCYIKFYYY